MVYLTADCVFVDRTAVVASAVSDATAAANATLRIVVGHSADIAIHSAAAAFEVKGHSAHVNTCGEKISIADIVIK